MLTMLFNQHESRPMQGVEQDGRDFIAAWYDRPSIKHAFEAIGKVPTDQNVGSNRVCSTSEGRRALEGRSLSDKKERKSEG